MHPIIHLARSYRNPSHWMKNVTWRFPSTISDIECVFVVGSPRSGTTLFQRVLSTHSRLVSIPGETGLFSYQNIFGRAHFGFSEDELQPLYRNCKDIVDFFTACVNKITDNDPSLRFVEKTPQHVLYLDFIEKHFPQAKIINIVRDGRDCYCSSRSYSGIPQNKSVGTFARYWQRCIRMANATKNPQRLHTMLYEDFCSAPESTLNETMMFLGLEAEEQQLEVGSIKNDPRASVSHFKRLNEPVTGSSVGRWQNDLSSEEVQQFESIAGAELKEHGYKLTTMAG